MIDPNHSPHLPVSDTVITPAHPLWKRLEGQALLKGDDHLFPVHFSSGDVWKIEYRVRHGYTRASACDLGGFTLLDAFLAGDSHPFWRSVGLPGVPMLWGASSIVTWRDRVLLGLKKPGLQFGGLLTPPGSGIVDVQDFEQGGTLRDILIRAALRELKEETNERLILSPAQVSHFETTVEQARCKWQAFVHIQLDELPELPEYGDYDEFEYLRFMGFSSEGWHALQAIRGTR